MFISSTTTLVCWFTLRAKKPQQTDYRLAGEHSVTPFVVPYAKQISTSLKKELTTDSLLQIEINPWSPGSQPNPDSSHRGLSGSFSPVIIPPDGTGPSTSIYFSAQESHTITITSSRRLYYALLHFCGRLGFTSKTKVRP